MGANPCSQVPTSGGGCLKKRSDARIARVGIKYSFPTWPRSVFSDKVNLCVPVGEQHTVHKNNIAGYRPTLEKPYSKE